MFQDKICSEQNAHRVQTFTVLALRWHHNLLLQQPVCHAYSRLYDESIHQTGAQVRGVVVESAVGLFSSTLETVVWVPYETMCVQLQSYSLFGSQNGLIGESKRPWFGSLLNLDPVHWGKKCTSVLQSNSYLEILNVTSHPNLKSKWICPKDSLDLCRQYISPWCTSMCSFFW